MKPKRERKLKLANKPKRWQLQEAKAKFSEVFELALNTGPQRVSRRQKDAVVVVRESDFDKLAHPPKRPTVMEALLAAPKLGELDIPRTAEFPKPAKDFH